MYRNADEQVRQQALALSAAYRAEVDNLPPNAFAGFSRSLGVIVAAVAALIVVVALECQSMFSWEGRFVWDSESHAIQPMFLLPFAVAALVALIGFAVARTGGRRLMRKMLLAHAQLGADPYRDEARLQRTRADQVAACLTGCWRRSSSCLALAVAGWLVPLAIQSLVCSRSVALEYRALPVAALFLPNLVGVILTGRFGRMIGTYPSSLGRHLRSLGWWMLAATVVQLFWSPWIIRVSLFDIGDVWLAIIELAPASFVALALLSWWADQ